MKIEEETMRMLITYFERTEINCAKIAREVKMPHGRVLSYFSAWLRDMTKRSTASETNARINNLPRRCPTCGKLKDEVIDMAVCRDVFHYL